MHHGGQSNTYTSKAEAEGPAESCHTKTDLNHVDHSPRACPLRGVSLIITRGATNKWSGVGRESMTPYQRGCGIYDPLHQNGCGIYDPPPPIRGVWNLYVMEGDREIFHSAPPQDLKWNSPEAQMT